MAKYECKYKQVFEKDSKCNVFIGSKFSGPVKIVAGQKFNSPKDDQEIQQAIENLYEATDDEGNKIFTEHGQWYAVYRVLKESCNYPEKMTDFARLINNNGWAKQEPYCKYGSIKLINSELPFLAEKVSMWHKYKNVDERYAKLCIVAERLMTLLQLL